MRLLIHSHVRLYREGLATILEREEDLQVAAVTSRVDECLAVAQQARADMVLLDTGAPAALELARSQARLRRPPQVVALGIPEDEGVVVAYAEAGVAAYVTREDSIEDLLVALRAAARGEVRCSSRTAAILLRRVAALAADRSDGSSAPPNARLTRRELEIASLVDVGLSNKQIAERLQIELPTVKNHVHHILEKLDVRRRGEAAAALRAQGLLRSEGTRTRAVERL